MPIYYLEIDDGIRVTVDGEGVAYRDVETAKRELISTLLQILSDGGPEQGSRDITGRITDTSGAEVYAAALSLRCGDVRGAGEASNPHGPATDGAC